MILYIDTETYSDTDISVGTYRYLQDVEVMLVSYAIGSGPVAIWDRTTGEPIPADLQDAIAQCEEVWAHNAMFDRNALSTIGVELPLTKWRCSMVKALANSLPGGLDKLCDLFRLGAEAKHKDGRRLIRKFCSPQSSGKRLTAQEEPLDWDQFREYAKADVLALRALRSKLKGYNYPQRELEHWQVDQVINDRGYLIDMELVDKAISLVERSRMDADARMRDLTAIEGATKRGQILEFLRSRIGIGIADLKASTVDKLLDSDLPRGCKEILSLFREANRSSTAKYKAVREGVTRDGRIKGTLQFNGASRTGRWSGRNPLQPQNLPRGHGDDSEAIISAIKDGSLAGDIMAKVSGVIRGVLIPSPGNRILASDLSNIEGRMLAWVAGENWKIKAFSEFDQGKGDDLYKLSYSRAFGVAVESVTPAQRTIGKVMELALGYQGGVGAFVTFALAYRLDLEALEVTVPGRVEAAATEYLHSRGKMLYGLSPRAFVVCESLKRLWREAHPRVVELWGNLEQACRNAIKTHHVSMPVGRLVARVEDNTLLIKLPSGRYLSYPAPQLERDKISYLGVATVSKKWGRIDTYGGKLTENVVQALAGNLFKDAVVRIEKAGYPVVLTVHDEVVVDAPEGCSEPELSDLLAVQPPWAKGLPLAAKGFTAMRYRK